MSLYEALCTAADILPEGWAIIMVVEEGEIHVWLEDPEGEAVVQNLEENETPEECVLRMAQDAQISNYESCDDEEDDVI